MYGLNFADGMFLGKQEMERQRQMQELYNNLYSLCLGNISSDGTVSNNKGLLDPRLTGLYIKAEVETSPYRIRVGINPNLILASDEAISKLGRGVIGFGPNGELIGAALLSPTSRGIVVLNDTFLMNNFPVDTGKNYIFINPGAEYASHYENCLINIASNGTGSLVGDEDLGQLAVVDALRNSAEGRPTKILTASGEVLTIASISGSSITFAEANTTARTMEKFSILSSMSPYSQNQPDYLYTYPCLGVSVASSPEPYSDDIFLLGEVEMSGGSFVSCTTYNGDTLTYGETFLGRRNVSDGSITTAKLANNAVNANKLANNAVETNKIKNGAVTGDKLGNQAVETSKIANQAVTTPKIADLSVTAQKIASDAVTMAKIADEAVFINKLNTNIRPVILKQDSAVAVISDYIYGVHPYSYDGSVTHFPVIFLSELSGNFYPYDGEKVWIGYQLNISSSELHLVSIFTSIDDKIPPLEFEIPATIDNGGKIYIDNSLFYTANAYKRLMLKFKLWYGQNTHYRIYIREILAESW